MTVWLCTLSRHHGSYRLTIPKALAEKAGFKRNKYLRLYDSNEGEIIIRGLKLNGEKTTNRKTSVNGSG